VECLNQWINCTWSSCDIERVNITGITGANIVILEIVSHCVYRETLLSCIHVIIIVIDKIQYLCNINYRKLTLRVGKIEWRHRLYLGVIVGTLVLLLLVLRYYYCFQSMNEVSTLVSNNITFNNPIMII